MLNDGVRNSAFHRAITLAVDDVTKETSDGELVILDIGTGSGILRFELICAFFMENQITVG